MFIVNNKINREDLCDLEKFKKISQQKIDFSKTFFKNEKNYDYLKKINYGLGDFDFFTFSCLVLIIGFLVYLSYDFYISDTKYGLIVTIPMIAMMAYCFYFNFIAPIFITQKIIDYIKYNIDPNYNFKTNNLKKYFREISAFEEWSTFRIDYFDIIKEGETPPKFTTLNVELIFKEIIPKFLFIEDEVIFITTIIFHSNSYLLDNKNSTAENAQNIITLEKTEIYTLIKALLYFYLFNNYKYNLQEQYKKKKKIYFSPIIENINIINRFILPHINNTELFFRINFLENIIVSECDYLMDKYKDCITKKELALYEKEKNKHFDYKKFILSSLFIKSRTA